MASEIRVNKIENRSGLGTVTFADTGVDLAGIVTATTFSGSGASLTSLPAANITGTLPAISAANLTNVPAANITGTLPAISAANLTNIPAANVTGTLPALTAANLTNIPAANLVGVCTSGLTKTGGFGKFASYAVLTDVKSSNGQGGTLTSGDWRTRDLNTETTDEDGIVSLSSNQFTLGAGSYLIQYFAPACQANSHQARLYNITDSSEASLGSTEYAGTGSNMPQTTSYGYIRLTLTGNKVFELQHRCSSTINNYGMGVGSAGGFNWGTTKFATVVIYKEA